MPNLNSIQNPTETQECEAFHQWLELKGIPHHHCANESQSGRKDAIIRNSRNKRMGQSRGFIDYLLVIPQRTKDGIFFGDSGYYCDDGTGHIPQSRLIGIEMKRRKGGTVSPDQKKWLKILNEAGIEAVVCRGFDEAKKFVEDR